MTDTIKHFIQQTSSALCSVLYLVIKNQVPYFILNKAVTNPNLTRLLLRKKKRKKYTSGPRYWNVPVLTNTGTFKVYQYRPKMWYLRSLEHASVIQKLTILEHKNGVVLSNTRVPVSGTWSILFPKKKKKNAFRSGLPICHKLFKPNNK